jgi:hypothetical protein
MVGYFIHCCFIAASAKRNIFQYNNIGRYPRDFNNPEKIRFSMADQESQDNGGDKALQGQTY